MSIWLMAAAALGALGGCQSSAGPRAGATSALTAANAAEPARVMIAGLLAEPDIRVRVVRAAREVSIGATGGAMVLVGPVALSPGAPPAVRMRPPVRIASMGSQWQLTDMAGSTARFDRAMVLEVAPMEAVTSPIMASVMFAPRGSSSGVTPLASASDARLVIEGQRYGGVARIMASGRDASAIDVVESLPIESYLPGVLSKELYPTWPAGAFEAQAVAARSYAISERVRARAGGKAFDVEASTADQAYGGASELRVAVDAVAKTRGVVLTWSGSVLRAYYCSTSGGRAASAADVWSGEQSGGAAPLRASARDDLGATSPWYRWTALRGRDELVARIKAWGLANRHAIANLSGLEMVKVAQSNSVGRPVKYLVVQPGGQSYTLSGEQLRAACSTKVSGWPEVPATATVRSGDMEWSIFGGAVTINGRGFGHGVGLCQWSAKELAARGVEYRSILNTFYPGARVERAY